MKMNKKITTIVIILMIPWGITILTFISNFYINKSKLSLQSVLNTSATKSYNKYYHVYNQERKVEYKFEQWHNGTSITLYVYDKQNNELLQVGGNIDTYIGLYDFNHDGFLDVYLFSTSIWPKKGIWLATTNGYRYINQNEKYRHLSIIKFFAYANIYLELMILFDVIWTVLLLLILKLLFLRRTKVTYTQQNNGRKLVIK